MNETNDSHNKSLYDSPRSFHENPKNELHNFSSICNTNLDEMERIQLLNIDENIWDDVHKEESDNISKEIKNYCVNNNLFDAEIVYTKKKINARKEDIIDMEQLVHECAVKFTELEHEKSEFTRKIINKHKAIKQAIQYYKKRLNIHISVEKHNEGNIIKISLYTHDNNERFSFIISMKEGEKTWRLESISPKLNDTQYLMIQQRFSEDQNISALLTLMRKIFLSVN